MFGKRLSHRVAIACLALSLALPAAALAAASSVAEPKAATSALLPPIYQYVNYRNVIIDGVPHECFDIQSSNDGGQTWNHVETVCNPL